VLVHFLTYSIRVQVNNAGFVKGIERVGDIADSDIEAMFSTNVFGLISMTQLFVPRRSSYADAGR
jgi:3-hydroxy acid dehydrogenase / malonic semialdehyde reductase